MAKEFNLSGAENMPTPEASVSTPDNNPAIPETGIHGLSEAETTDPNSIVVTIADQEAPIIVLFGPTECGKTMTLTRMTRFLQKYDYRVAPIRSFRPSTDTHYQQICENFNELVHSSSAAQGTEMISFMLVEVLDKNGRRICQILEAPGEYYFDPKNPGEEFPTYVNTIINSGNRKIWLFMIEPDWKDPSERSAYVSRIQNLKTRMRPQDKAIFLYNKVDKSNFVVSPGHVNMNSIKNDTSNMYPGIFTPFTNFNPITKFFKQYMCDLVPFSNGTFTKATKADGTDYLAYQQGVDEYPQLLWNTILKRIRG